MNSTDQQSQNSNPTTGPVTESGQAVDQPKKALPTVLLIEDDPVLSRMYKEKFKHEGFEVLTAFDGEAGLKSALENKVDVILLDIMLPKLSGTDMLIKLRETQKGKNIPVVALSNLAEKEEKEKALEYGVKDYLVKAMQTPEQVISKVKSYIRPNA